MMERPIGLFDSGVGGLTVVKELAKRLPQEHFLYFGDTAHLPYGNKSPETILKLASDNARFLLEQKIKLLIIPCHTACSHALKALQEKLPIPVIGVIEAGLKQLSGYRRIAVLATAGTIKSGVYQRLIAERYPKAEVVAVPCPLFVPLVEEGFAGHAVTEQVAEEYLGHLRGKIDAALLACTHYPLLKSVLQKVLGRGVALIEPAVGTVEEARVVLLQKGLLNQGGAGTRLFYASDDPEKFRQLGSLFLGLPIERVLSR